MTFYKDRFNVWHEDRDFFHMADIFAGAFPAKSRSEEFFVDCGAISEIKRFQDEPDVIDYLKMGMKVAAVRRYYYIHGVTLKESREMVEKIQKDMEV